MKESPEYEIKPAGTFRLGLRELSEFSELFYFFTWRDLKVKYKQTALGIIWVLLQPLLMMLIFSFFFGRALSISTDGVPYPLFALSGLVLWNIFATGINSAGNSLVQNVNIIKKIYFPRLIIPISAVLAALVDFFAGLILLTAFFIAYGQGIAFATFLVFFPLSILLAFIGTTGCGLLLGALNVKYRDFRYVIPFLLQIMLFLSPVIYPFSLLPQKLQYIAALNPAYAPIELFRHSLLQTPIETLPVLLSTGSSLLLLITGFWYFRKTEAYFADIA